MTLDYIFKRRKLESYGSKGFLQDAVHEPNRHCTTATSSPSTTCTPSIRLGSAPRLDLFGNTYLEGNLGYLKSRANADRLGGTARFVFPISDRFAFTLEGGMNETLVSPGNTGRVVAGFQFGNFMRPKDYLEGYNGVQHAVPADVPRVRYEILTRTVRTGNDAPIANAGPDQIGVAAGPITLDGSASYDPEGDAITYQWTQVAGPAVSLSGMNTARASFTAAEGQSYGFRLLVKDPQGPARRRHGNGHHQHRTQPFRSSVSRLARTAFASGQQSTLDWQVLNADSVTITELGTVPSNGSRAVSPTRTTQYRLTARNRNGEATATTTVVVEEQPAAQFTACTVSPTTILTGESATISYATSNADTVEISGIGPVAGSGSQVVSPTSTTTYTLTARNPRGPVTCSLTVQVTEGSAPRVVSFTASPATITSGNASTLSWSVENADSVTISSLGTVQATGTRQVSPTTTTTYTLTATNKNGSITSTSVVTVSGAGPGPGPGAPTLASCTASPSTSPSPGSPITISYVSTNATSVAFTPTVPGAGLNGPVTVMPTASTTYTITATGANNQAATCTVAVTVTPAPQPPTAIITGGGVIETFNREVVLSGAESSNPTGGALTYQWTPLGTGAAVLDQGQQRTRVQLAGLAGDYPVRLTVRNAAGAESSTDVTIRFRSTTIP